jgi:predicted enzyme related to lactoylglutathione lyase
MDALLGAIWLYSTDVARTAAFYRDVVGLRLVEEDTDEGGEVAHFDAGNIRLSIHPWAGAGSPGGGAFYVFIVDDLETEADRLESRGVEVERTNELYGRIAGFHDPDGHRLFLWQLPDEGSEAYERIRPLAEHHARLVSTLRV